MVEKLKINHFFKLCDENGNMGSGTHGGAWGQRPTKGKRGLNRASRRFQ
jgi:hypothetical protein